MGINLRGNYPEIVAVILFEIPQIRKLIAPQDVK